MLKYICKGKQKIFLYIKNIFVSSLSGSGLQWGEGKLPISNMSGTVSWSGLQWGEGKSPISNMSGTVITFVNGSINYQKNSNWWNHYHFDLDLYNFISKGFVISLTSPFANDKLQHRGARYRSAPTPTTEARNHITQHTGLTTMSVWGPVLQTVFVRSVPKPAYPKPVTGLDSISTHLNSFDRKEFQEVVGWHVVTIIKVKSLLLFGFRRTSKWTYLRPT